MKRTLTLTYSSSVTDSEHSVSKEYDIEDYELSDLQLQALEHEIQSLIPSEHGVSWDLGFDWDFPPAPIRSGKNPPEDAWINIDGRRWATDGVIIIAEDQPIRIFPWNRWKVAGTIDVRKFGEILAGSYAVTQPHCGFFGTCFKPFDLPGYSVLASGDSRVLNGYVFDDGDRLVAVIAPIEQRKDGVMTATMFRFNNEEAIAQ